ncbi:hypothetical protein FB451DRAFT_1011165, partial [Mycena latifolia]
LPEGAYHDGGMYHCGIAGCAQQCSSAADMRRHRESLAHCAKRYNCPGCLSTFTRADARKRHLTFHPRCASPH